jgi:hypothetical protein
LSLLGELDFYDDILNELNGNEKALWFICYVLFTMIALVVVMNIFLTVVMDAFAEAKNDEDKKVEVMNARSNVKLLAKRIARKRFKIAYKATIKQLAKKASDCASVVPVDKEINDLITDDEQPRK